MRRRGSTIAEESTLRSGCCQGNGHISSHLGSSICKRWYPRILVWSQGILKIPPPNLSRLKWSGGGKFKKARVRALQSLCAANAVRSQTIQRGGAKGRVWRADDARTRKEQKQSGCCCCCFCMLRLLFFDMRLRSTAHFFLVFTQFFFT